LGNSTQFRWKERGGEKPRDGNFARRGVLDRGLAEKRAAGGTIQHHALFTKCQVRISVPMRTAGGMGGEEKEQQLIK